MDGLGSTAKRHLRTTTSEERTTNYNMKTFAYVVVSFAAFAPMHAYAGQAQVPSAPFQLADDSNNYCGNGILNILNCNDVDVGVVIGQTQFLTRRPSSPGRGTITIMSAGTALQPKGAPRPLAEPGNPIPLRVPRIRTHLKPPCSSRMMRGITASPPSPRQGS